MATRNISLTEYFDEYIDDEVASGRYQNASEVVRAGLRLLELERRERERRQAALDSSIAEAKAEVAAGRVDVIETDGELVAYMEAVWVESAPAVPAAVTAGRE